MDAVTFVRINTTARNLLILRALAAVFRTKQPSPGLQGDTTGAGVVDWIGIGGAGDVPRIGVVFRKGEWARTGAVLLRAAVLEVVRACVLAPVMEEVRATVVVLLLVLVRTGTRVLVLVGASVLLLVGTGVLLLVGACVLRLVDVWAGVLLIEEEDGAAVLEEVGVGVVVLDAAVVLVVVKDIL